MRLHLAVVFVELRARGSLSGLFEFPGSMGEVRERTKAYHDEGEHGEHLAVGEVMAFHIGMLKKSGRKRIFAQMDL